MMRTYRLEKAPILNDGTQGVWETSTFGGTVEIWHDAAKARESADDRDLSHVDDCYWRVEGDAGW